MLIPALADFIYWQNFRKRMHTTILIADWTISLLEPMIFYLFNLFFKRRILTNPSEVRCFFSITNLYIFTQV